MLLLSFGLNHARADDEDVSGISPLDRPDYNPDYNSYERASSHFAYGLRVAFDGFPVGSAAGNSYQFYGDWVLPFQKMGLFSLGAHVGSFPVVADNTSETGIPYPNYTDFTAGIQFRYQMIWANNQLIVPTAAVEMDYYRIVTSSLTLPDSSGVDQTTETSTSGITPGLDLGIMINLGKIDTATALDAYQTLKMTRAYLTLEWHPLKISNSDVNLSGNLFYTGLRMEFE